METKRKVLPNVHCLRSFMTRTAKHSLCPCPPLLLPILHVAKQQFYDTFLPNDALGTWQDFKTKDGKTVWVMTPSPLVAVTTAPPAHLPLQLSMLVALLLLTRRIFQDSFTIKFPPKGGATIWNENDPDATLWYACQLPLSSEVHLHRQKLEERREEKEEKGERGDRTETDRSC